MNSLSLGLTFRGRGTRLSKPLVIMWLLSKANVVITNKFEHPREVRLIVELALESSVVA